MKILFLALFACAVIASTMVDGRAQEPGLTVLEKGLFSYQAPLGWRIAKTSISIYQVAEDRSKNGFAANINANLATDPGSVDDDIAQIQSGGVFKSKKLISRQPFVTTAGLDGTRIIFADNIKGCEMQQVFYIFNVGSKQKLFFVGSCLLGDAAAYTPLFDASLKSLTLE